MTAESKHEEVQGVTPSLSPMLLPDVEPAPRTEAEKARILAHLTMQLAALEPEGARDDGNA